MTSLRAFKHLSLYIQNHFKWPVTLNGQWHYVAVCGKVDHGTPGTAGHSQVKPGTATYSAEKTHHMLYL